MRKHSIKVSGLIVTAITLRRQVRLTTAKIHGSARRGRAQEARARAKPNLAHACHGASARRIRFGSGARLPGPCAASHARGVLAVVSGTCRAQHHQRDDQTQHLN